MTNNGEDSKETAKRLRSYGRRHGRKLRKSRLDLLNNLLPRLRLDMSGEGAGFDPLRKDPSQVAKLAAEVGPLVDGGRVVDHTPQPLADEIHPLKRLLNLPHHGLHATRPQAEFLNQREHLATPANEPLAGFRADFRWRPPVD